MTRYGYQFACLGCGCTIFAAVHHGADLCAECQFWRACDHSQAEGALPARHTSGALSAKCLRWGIGISVVLWVLLIGLVVLMVKHL